MFIGHLCDLYFLFCEMFVHDIGHFWFVFYLLIHRLYVCVCVCVCICGLIFYFYVLNFDEQKFLILL